MLHKARHSAQHAVSSSHDRTHAPMLQSLWQRIETAIMTKKTHLEKKAITHAILSRAAEVQHHHTMDTKSYNYIPHGSIHTQKTLNTLEKLGTPFTKVHLF